MNKTATTQPAKTANFLPPSHGILQRKCACGNHTISGGECADCAKKKMGLQRKLTIGASNDPLEQEADRIADQVMASPNQDAVSSVPVKVQRFTGNPSGQTAEAPASIERVLASPGRPLEPALRQDMERRFGHDFSQVRVHTSSVAEQSVREVNANAYTVRNNIVFGANQFVPETQEGRRLLAHELTHVIQQSAFASIPRVQKQERQSDASLAGTHQDQVTPSIPRYRYRIRVVGHASPRWRHPSASTPERQNLALSLQRAQAVESAIRSLFRTRERPIEFDLSSAVIDLDSDSLESSGRGMEETLREAGGERDADNPILRRVDVEINIIRQATGSAGYTEAITLSTATIRWSINVDIVAGALGVAVTKGKGELKNRQTGQRVEGGWLAFGGGLAGPRALPPLPTPSYSPGMGNWVDFETMSPVTFASFDSASILLISGAAGVGFGGGVAAFSFTDLMRGFVTLSGVGAGIIGLQGSVTAGPWRFTQQIPPPPTEGRERRIPYQTTAGAQHGHLVLFHTGENSISEAERASLAGFVARLP